MNSFDSAFDLTTRASKRQIPPLKRPLTIFERIGIGIAALAVFVLLFLWYIGVFGGNLHTVQPGMVYRSAELTGSNLETVFKTDNIKTDINLRGVSPSKDWYRSEVATCKAYGVKHVDITLSSRRFPAPEKLAEMIRAFDTSSYPILFHCQAGADRSGLVGTLYLMIYRHVPLQAAKENQLTWRYGHMSFGQSHAMDDFLSLYARASNGQDIRAWIMKSYPALYSKLPKDEQTPTEVVGE